MRGVMQTRAAWLDSHEVTEVWFDPSVVTFEKVLQQGQQQQCATRVWTTSDAQFAVARRLLGELAQPLTSELRADKEPKYYLLQTPLRFVPMTALQAARCNAAIARKSTNGPELPLSPRQRALLRRLEQHGNKGWPVAVDVPIEKAWAAVPAEPKAK